MQRLHLLLAGMLVLAFARCGPEAPPLLGSQGALELLSPTSPIGLRYGERTQLRLRYLWKGEPRDNAALLLSSSGALNGSTLSAARVVTDRAGEATFTLQAGAAEAAFQVVISGPDAQDLPVDVAVSRRSFGGVSVLLTRRGLARGAAVRTLRASLLDSGHCGELAPAPQPPPALRTLREELLPGHEEATLPFGTLLLRDYTVIGRAEDSAGHLLGWGCVELPEESLLAMPEATAPLPLRDVYSTPAGSYSMRMELELDPLGALWSPWGELACPLGAGQALLDAVLLALPAREMPLVSRLQAHRGAVGADRCRPSRRGADDTADLALDQALSAAGKPGERLRPVALDLRALQRRFVLLSRLDVRGATGLGVIADHAITQLVMGTGAATSRHELGTLLLPILQARDLLLPMTGDRIDLPTHAFTLRLPMLWRLALSDVVLAPRGIASMDRLLQDSVAAARSGGKAGCAAVESLLCALAGPPCIGVLLPACDAGVTKLSADLVAALRDGATGLDLSLAGFVVAEDREGSLLAQSLGGGQVAGMVQIGAGRASASGPLSGTRP